MTHADTVDEIIAQIEADLATATGARRDNLTRRLNRLRNAPTSNDAAELAGTGNHREAGPTPTRPLVDSIDQRGDATQRPGTTLPSTASTASGRHQSPSTDGQAPAAAVPSTGSQPPPVQITGSPVGSGRARTRVADKVRARAAHLAKHPMPLDPTSRFAPAARVQDGLFLSGDGKLLIARDGDDWKVNEFEITNGELRVVGEVTTYPSAQQALVAVRLQMQAGVA